MVVRPSDPLPLRRSRRSDPRRPVPTRPDRPSPCMRPAARAGLRSPSTSHRPTGAAPEARLHPAGRSSRQTRRKASRWSADGVRVEWGVKCGAVDWQSNPNRECRSRREAPCPPNRPAAPNARPARARRGPAPSSPRARPRPSTDRLRRRRRPERRPAAGSRRGARGARAGEGAAAPARGQEGDRASTRRVDLGRSLRRGRAYRRALPPRSREPADRAAPTRLRLLGLHPLHRRRKLELEGGGRAPGSSCLRSLERTCYQPAA